MNFKYNEATIVDLARYFNQELTALAPIRLKQDNKLVDSVRERAIEKMNGAPTLKDSKLFYVGSVDFMVITKEGQNKFAILESNGGSSRGLLSLSLEQVELIFRAYKQAIDECSTSSRRFILIGRMPIDNLYQEKIMLMEFLKQEYHSEGLKVGIYTPLTYNSVQAQLHDIVLLVADYGTLLKELSYREKQVFYKDEPVDLLIGDGIARRFPILGSAVKKNWRVLKTGIVNPIYHITDDKFNTYLAEYFGRNILDEYNVHHLKFGKVSTREQLKGILDKKSSDGNLIIKPFGGSGGAGILPILKNITKNEISKMVDQSIAEFHQKFMDHRDPFPYTIQEMAKFNLISWHGSKRTFDLRIYVAQLKGELIPIGGEARIARAPFTGALEKNEFVVNICGEWGVEFERAYALSRNALQTLKMSEDDLIDIFCASSQLFRIICEKYHQITSFNQWDTFL